MPTLYDILGVAATASPEEVRVAYAAIREGLIDPNDTTSYFRQPPPEIEAAFETLSQPTLRRAYDATLPVPAALPAERSAPTVVQPVSLAPAAAPTKRVTGREDMAPPQTSTGMDDPAAAVLNQSPPKSRRQANEEVQQALWDDVQRRWASGEVSPTAQKLRQKQQEGKSWWRELVEEITWKGWLFVAAMVLFWLFIFLVPPSILKSSEPAEPAGVTHGDTVITAVTLAGRTQTIVASRKGYAQTSCGTIIDERQGLEWRISNAPAASWAEARAWADSDDPCAPAAGAWRLPTTAELLRLFDRRFTAGAGFARAGRRYPAHIHPFFAHIGETAWVWSAEAGQAGQAYCVNFNQGIRLPAAPDGRAYPVRAFAVRKSRF